MSVANTVNNLDSAPEYNIPRPPRLASSSNSPHQSDTPSIVQFLTILLLAAPAVYACGDNSYRCKIPDATVDQMWQRKIATARTGPSTTAIPTATTSTSSRASARRKARAGIGPSVESGKCHREITVWSRFELTLSISLPFTFSLPRSIFEHVHHLCPVRHSNIDRSQSFGNCRCIA